MQEEHRGQIDADADLFDLELTSGDTDKSNRPGMRASILAGLTLGVTAAVLIGQDISTVVSHAGGQA